LQLAAGARGRHRSGARIVPAPLLRGRGHRDSYGKQFRGKPSDSELPISKVLREFDRPDINVERTDYGIRLVTLRKIDERQTHGRRHTFSFRRRSSSR
jgi:hypothetical protein